MADVAMLQSVGLSAVERPLYDLECKKQLSLPFFEWLLSPTLASSPCLFLLFSESFPKCKTHTHEYRAFHYRLEAAASGRGEGCWFEPRAVHILNSKSIH
ncbi:hypothetical protein CY35_04G046800 [Sphagnum magellanicum]|nr:hypothetical protein CY35_04G046800 [Sphagnum magellanicum]